MTVALRCKCGQVRGEVDLSQAYTRGTCYCRDCQAFVRFLGREDVLDARGGTDIVPMAPSGVRFTAGREHVACLSLSPTGMLRWHASCCRTPLGNTQRDARMFYVGMLVASLDAAPQVLDEALGPRDRVVLNTSGASGPVRSTPLAFLLGGLGIFARVIGARLRGRRVETFFDKEGRPIREPQVLTAEQRASLGLPAA